jgi:hypothetical protein
MGADMGTEIDASHRRADDTPSRLLDRLEGPAQRQYRAVVLGIGVDIEHGRATCISQCADRRQVPPLTDVDDALGQ